MIAFKRDSDMPYKMHCTPEELSLICNQEKKFPKEWINVAGNDITDDFSAYALPLIQGEPKRVMENGVPEIPVQKVSLVLSPITANFTKLFNKSKSP